MIVRIIPRQAPMLAGERRARIDHGSRSGAARIRIILHQASCSPPWIEEMQARSAAQGSIVRMAPAVQQAGYDDEHEDEPIAESSAAIISEANCTTTRMTAYDRGRAYPIDVIKIANKRASKTTGHAFLKMQKAAHAAGVNLTLSSGFRTNDEQQYFYNCYRTKRCNNGNLAARPGYSNHQNGRALDLSTSSWLSSNASRFGFKRTVPSEPWHYEYNGADPGGPCSANATPPPPAAEPEGDDETPATPPPASSGGGQACGSDGQCNPGNDGAGLICQDGTCVDGCRTNAQCPGMTTCKNGLCK